MVRYFSSEDRTASINRLFPNLFKKVWGKESVLYIGARSDRFDYAQELHDAGHHVYVLEAHEPNYRWVCEQKWCIMGIHDDIRDFEMPPPFSGVFFWHGIEHLVDEEISGVLDKLESNSRWVVLGCPWGVYEQDDLGGNPYEAHLSSIYPEFLEERGYTVECLGSPDVKGSNITAVKFCATIAQTEKME